MEGLRRAQHFSGLVIDTLQLTARTQREQVSMVFDPGDPVFAASRQAMEYLLMASRQLAAPCRRRELPPAGGAFPPPPNRQDRRGGARLRLPGLFRSTRQPPRLPALGALGGAPLRESLDCRPDREIRRRAERPHRGARRRSPSEPSSAMRALLASGVRATSHERCPKTRDDQSDAPAKARGRGHQRSARCATPLYGKPSKCCCPTRRSRSRRLR